MDGFGCLMTVHSFHQMMKEISIDWLVFTIYPEMGPQCFLYCLILKKMKNFEGSFAWPFPFKTIDPPSFSSVKIPNTDTLIQSRFQHSSNGSTWSQTINDVFSQIGAFKSLMVKQTRFFDKTCDTIVQSREIWH